MLHTLPPPHTHTRQYINETVQFDNGVCFFNHTLPLRSIHLNCFSSQFSCVLLASSLVWVSYSCSSLHPLLPVSTFRFPRKICFEHLYPGFPVVRIFHFIGMNAQQCKCCAILRKWSISLRRNCHPIPLWLDHFTLPPWDILKHIIEDFYKTLF